MKVQSIFYIDHYDNVHNTGVYTIERPTVKEILLELHRLLSDKSTGLKPYSIQAFSDDGRFFLVHEHNFIVTYYGRFTPKGDDITKQSNFSNY